MSDEKNNKHLSEIRNCIDLITRVNALLELTIDSVSKDTVKDSSIVIAKDTIKDNLVTIESLKTISEAQEPFNDFSAIYNLFSETDRRVTITNDVISSMINFKIIGDKNE